MFEQTFIQEDAPDNKRYTVLVSLLLQIATICALIIMPLIYTQVLPQARLRSVFAAPTPPPPALPKAPPSTVKPVARPISNNFRILPLDHFPTLQRRDPPTLAATAPDLPGGDPAGVAFSIGDPVGSEVRPPDPPKPPAIHPPVATRVKIGTIDPSQLIYKVQPAYPAMARNIRVQGVVEFTAIISKTGTIENLQLVHGHPLLVAAAKEAILQWRYKPTLLNGEPVEVITNIQVNFTLNQ